MRIVEHSFIAVVASVALALAGCGAVAVYTAPAKVATTQRSDAAKSADGLFWETLHNGDYDGIDKALQVETAAYLQDPNDAVTATHVGLLHLWRLAESARSTHVAATITDDATVAHRYFQEAVAIDPSDARYLGFLASSELAEGSIHHDEKLTRQGYFRLRDAVDAWPEFNLFIVGYVMGGQPATSKQFEQSLAAEWENLDACVGERVDRHNFDYAKYVSLATDQGSRRVCWNSAIAPHNVEGFFLNFGDLLVKSGDWQAATRVYAAAKLSPTYRDWPYAPVLQAHIDHARENVAVFNGPAAARGAAGEKIMFASAHACMACHQR